VLAEGPKKHYLSWRSKRMVYELFRKYWKPVFDIMALLVLVYLFVLGFSHLYHIATPVFMSLIIYWMVRPSIQFWKRKGLNKHSSVAVSMLGFVLILVIIIGSIGTICSVQMVHLINKMPQYDYTIRHEVVAKVQERMQSLSPDELSKVKEYAATAAQKAVEVVKVIFQNILIYTTSVSKFVIHIVVAIILAYYRALESDKWKDFYRQKTPSQLRSVIDFLNQNVLSGIGKYIIALLKIIGFSFVVIWICLLILGFFYPIHNTLVLSLLAGFSSILPVLGAGFVFVPWIAILLLSGKFVIAIWLAIVFTLSVVLKHVIEPKVLGDTLGVSAFTMLATLIIALEAFGVAGMILAPVLIILFKALYKNGILLKLIRKPTDEPTHEN
jgi:sporulation integral membrane protein YtvI